MRPIFGVENPAGVLTELLCQNDYERLLAKVGVTYAKNEDRKSIGEASRRARRDERGSRILRCSSGNRV